MIDACLFGVRALEKRAILPSQHKPHDRLYRHTSGDRGDLVGRHFHPLCPRRSDAALVNRRRQAGCRNRRADAYCAQPISTPNQESLPAEEAPDHAFGLLPRYPFHGLGFLATTHHRLSQCRHRFHWTHLGGNYGSHEFSGFACRGWSSPDCWLLLLVA